MKYILPVIFLILFLPSCVRNQTKNPSEPVQYVEKIVDLPDCSRPERVKLPSLDSSQHLGSVSNLSILDEIFISMSSYIDQLEGTIDCYERRKGIIKEKESTENKEIRNDRGEN